MKTSMLGVTALGLAVGGLAGELTWSAAPESPAWNCDVPNWRNAADESVAWDSTHNATFGESTVKAIEIEGEVCASNLTFTADGYVIGGDGTLLLDRPETETSPEWHFHVDDGLTARIDATIQRKTFGTHDDGTLLKKGLGTLHLAGTTTVLRLHSRAGVVDLTGGTFNAAKLRASFLNSVTSLRLDGTRFMMKKSNNGIFLGDVAPFTEATLGAGGLTVLPGDEGEFMQNISTAPGVERDGGIVHESQHILRLTGDASTFNGGVLMKSGQLRVSRTGALGSGDVVLRPSASFFTYFRDILVTNKIIQSHSSFAGSTGGENDNVTFTSVGVTDDNMHGEFVIGRPNGAYSRAALSLTGATTEPIGTFSMQGDLDLTIDGGTITAREDSPTPFFTTTSFSSARAPTAKIGQGGFTFDSNGATTELGVDLDMSTCRVTNVVASAQGFANASFEESPVTGQAPQGWTITGGIEPASGVQSNGSGFTNSDAAYETTNGTHYLVLRRQSTASTTFEVAEAGDWRIFFDMGGRSGTYPTHNISVTVTIDGVHEFTIGPRESNHPFRRFETAFYPLAAGTHTLSISADAGSAWGFDSVLFDVFGVERFKGITAPPVEKRGEGSLGIARLATDGEVNVAAGTLALRDPRIDGAAINVAQGAELSFVAGCVSNAAVRVASGGALTFRDSAAGENIVRNGSFEVDSTPDRRENSAEWHVTDWLFGWAGEDRTPSGVQRNGGAMSPTEKGGPFTTYGDQTYFLRYDGVLKQSVGVPESGRYKLSFVQASRIYGVSYALALTVRVDGEVVITNAPHTANYDFFRSSVEIDLEKGKHEISFTATGASGSGVLLLLDDVRLEGMYTGATEMPGTVLDLASGATIDVQMAKPLLIDEALVDGRPVKGFADALRAAGVNVTGNGKLRIGPPQGTMLLVR